METPVTDPVALLSELTHLGPVRVILRNCSGAVELPCSGDDIVVTPTWLYVGAGGARLQLHVATLGGASFHDGCEAHPERTALRFYGRCGTTCLIVVCDRTDGPARGRQDAQLRRLRARYGTRVAFAAAPASASAERTLH